jgi:hypothetical protein
MRQIGAYALKFFYAFRHKAIAGKFIHHNISGVLALRKKYENNVIDQACRRALYYNSITYGTVKKICERGIIGLPVDDRNDDTVAVGNEATEITRDLSQYDQMAVLGVIGHE